jgi:hypothetical protein
MHPEKPRQGIQGGHEVIRLCRRHTALVLLDADF